MDCIPDTFIIAAKPKVFQVRKQKSFRKLQGQCYTLFTSLTTLFFFFIYFIELQSIYNVVLIYIVQQSGSVIHTHTYIYILFHILFHYGLSQDTEYSFPVLPSRTVLLTHSLYTSLRLLIPAPSPSLPQGPSPLAICPLLLRVSFCFVNRFICIILQISHRGDVIRYLSFSFHLQLIR